MNRQIDKKRIQELNRYLGNLKIQDKKTKETQVQERERYKEKSKKKEKV